jgi:hypothetical protein
MKPGMNLSDVLIVIGLAAVGFALWEVDYRLGIGIPGVVLLGLGVRGAAAAAAADRKRRLTNGQNGT